MSSWAGRAKAPPKTTALICFLLLLKNIQSWVLSKERAHVLETESSRSSSPIDQGLWRAPDFWEQAWRWADFPMGSTIAVNWVLRGLRQVGFLFLPEMPLQEEVPVVALGQMIALVGMWFGLRRLFCWKLGSQHGRVVEVVEFWRLRPTRR